MGDCDCTIVVQVTSAIGERSKTLFETLSYIRSPKTRIRVLHFVSAAFDDWFRSAYAVFFVPPTRPRSGFFLLCIQAPPAWLGLALGSPVFRHSSPGQREWAKDPHGECDAAASELGYPCSTRVCPDARPVWSTGMGANPRRAALRRLRPHKPSPLLSRGFPRPTL